VTAAHCIRAGNSLVLYDWIPGADGLQGPLGNGIVAPNGFKNIVWYRWPSSWVNDDGPSRDDYAGLALMDNENSCSNYYFGYRADSTLVQTQVQMWGTPGEAFRCERSLRADKQCFGSIYGDSRPIIRTEQHFLFTYIDTQKGQSGAPLYVIDSDGQRYIVGTHITDYTSVENRHLRVQDGYFNFLRDLRSDFPCSF
jgi:hypothetical protein